MPFKSASTMLRYCHDWNSFVSETIPEFDAGDATSARFRGAT
jgi:hypothetical protein